MVREVGEEEYGEPPVEAEPVPQTAIVPAPVRGGELAVQSPAGDFAPFKGAGENAVTPEQAKILGAIFEDKEHDIKPTGEVFVPQVHVRRRLNAVFMPGGWAMVPMSEVRVKKIDWKQTFFQKWHMVVNGKFVGEAWGEQDYVEKNENVTEATALEGTKSNAIVRISKDLGIAWECWDKSWCEEWKKKYAVEKWTVNVSNGKNKGQKKKFWRLNTREPFTFPWSENFHDSKKGEDGK